MPEINSEDYLEELFFSLEHNDRVKLSLVLSHLISVNEDVQKNVVAELSRTNSDIVAAILTELISKKPKILSSIKGLQAVFRQHLISDISVLLACLQDANFKHKNIPIDLAGQLQLVEAIPVLLEITKSSNSDKEIKQAIEALGMIGDTAAISQLSEYLYSGKREIITASVVALGAIGTPSAIQRLEERMGSDSGLDMLILNIFAKIQTPLTLKKLNETIRSHHAHLRNFAKTKLLEIGDKAVPVLIENLNFNDPDSVIHALNVIGDIGDESAVDPIRKLLRNEPRNANVRFAAYEALGKMPVEKGAYTMAIGLSDPVMHVAVAAAKAIDKNFSPIFETGLKNLVHSEPENIEKYLEILITSESDNIFLALSKADQFIDSAIKYLNEHSPEDARKKYKMLLENNGFADHAKKIKIAIEKPKSLDKKLVWAVDDSRMMLSIYKNALFNLDYDTKLYEFPESAIEDIAHEKPDLIITDLNMPNVSGIELTKTIRKRYTKAELPIIMITTQSDAQGDKAILDSGVSLILYKPFTKEDLGSGISKYFDN